MNLSRAPHWALTTIETPTRLLPAVLLESGTSSSYSAIRNHLTLTGCISRISPTDWQQNNWPHCGRLQLHHAANRITRLTTPGPSLHIAGGLDARQEWIDAATGRGHALFAVLPPRPANSQTGPGEPTPATATDYDHSLRLVDLAHTGQLTGGLANIHDIAE